MCFGGSPSVPAAPAPVPAPAVPQIVAPIEANTEALASGDDERRRRQSAAGRSDTILTGGSGLSDPATTGGKKLLGG